MALQALLTGGRLALFGRSPAGLLGGMWQEEPAHWSTWIDLGPALDEDPVIVESADGRLELFAVGRDGLLGHRAQLDQEAGGGWSGWEQVGPADSGRPAITQNADGRLEVFAGGPGGSLGHAWQIDPSGRSGWSPWEDLESPIQGDPAVFQNADGRLELFAAGRDGRLGHRWQLVAGGHSGWSEWELFGPEIAGRPAVLQGGDGRLELFAAGPGAVLGSTWQAGPSGLRGWGPWGELGPRITSAPAVFQNADGRLEVFAAGPDGQLGHLWQWEVGGATGWSDWEELGPVISGDPAIFQNADGRLEVFAAGPGGVLGHRWQIDTSGRFGWSEWAELGVRIAGSVSVCQAQNPAGHELLPLARVPRAGRARAARTLKADVCVVGAGPAGITVSRDLVEAGASVVLAESGQVHQDAAAQELNRGLADGPILKGYWRYLLDGRWRGVQGAAAGWGRGFCMPFQPVDFKHRPWITYSGWPLTRDQVAPYERLAAATFGFEPFSSQPRNGTLTRASYRFPADPYVFRATFAELADHARFHPELGATAIELTARGDCVESVRFACSDGGELRVEAGAVVLAAGAVENARLLLLNEGALPDASDATGMYFMEHPHVLAGEVELPNASDWASYLADMNNLDVPGFDVLALDDRRQWDERLHNATVQLRPKVVAPYGDRPLECFLYVRAEQAPNPDSRVELGDRQDPLGMRWPVLHWRLLGRDWNSIVRTTELVVDALEREHGARGELFIQPDFPWPWTPAGPADTENATWGYHHLGTTRMSDTPDRGVVDLDCRVFGTSNLYVAGSSVFPTGGAANPTFMIVALAHRLADHLAGVTT